MAAAGYRQGGAFRARQGGTQSGGMGAAPGSMAAAAPDAGRQAQCQLVAATGMAASSRARQAGGRVLLIAHKAAPKAALITVHMRRPFATR